MKKHVVAIVLLLFAIAVAGCSSTPTSITPTPSDASSTPAQSIASSNPLLNATLDTKPVKSGSGDTIGTYAFIKISKSVLQEITFDEYEEFIAERVSSEYNWVSIMCYDGTGISIPCGDATLAYYGEFDTDNSMGEVYGYIDLTSGTYQAATDMESMDPNFAWLE